MKRTPRVVGFVQAAGVAAYIALFATLAYGTRTWIETSAVAVHPILGITLFLLAFVISALVCTSIALAYPATLFFGGARSQALSIVLWSAVWLALMSCLVALIVFSTAIGLLF